MNKSSIIKVERVTFGYDHTPALEDVDLSIGELDFAWVVGPNGGGKTTLLKLLLGLLQPDRGRIEIYGKSPEKARPQIGYLPQAVSLDGQFPASVIDVVLMGRLGNGPGLGPYRGDDKDAAEKALDEVGLLDKRNSRFSSLSGGQKRRLLIARALACQPRLLLLDEPTANLDLKAEKELFEILRKLNGFLTVIMVSHDPTFVSDFADRVVCVNRHVHEHPTEEVDSAFMSEFFGSDLRMIRHDKNIMQKKRDD